jgi:hypothetical protein
MSNNQTDIQRSDMRYDSPIMPSSLPTILRVRESGEVSIERYGGKKSLHES